MSFVGYASPSTSPGSEQSDHILTNLQKAKGERQGLQKALAAGKLVAVQGASEETLEEVLNIKLDARVVETVNEDKSGHVPLAATAVGVLRKNNGTYHTVHYVGDVTPDRVKNSVAKAKELAMVSETSGEIGGVSAMVITNNPDYTKPSGQVNYLYEPYGEIVSSWYLTRDTSTGEHLWTGKFTNNINPGDLYWNNGWVVNNFKPQVSVNYSGQLLRDGDPQTVSSDGTFAVTLGYQAAEASWSWNVPAVSVTEQCRFSGYNYCSWIFSYRWFSSSQYNTTKQMPGVMATNTVGSFYISHTNTMEWIHEISGNGTTTDTYTVYTADF